MKSVLLKGPQSLRGTLKIPPDKSISHRAVIFSALSEGTSRIENILKSEDVLATLKCFQNLGVPIHFQDQTLIIEGRGLRGLSPPSEVLDCGNSGTTLRLMLGVLSGQDFEATLTGDESLNRRPMDRVIHPLKQMGACIIEERISSTARFIHVKKSKKLKGIHFKSPIASAQIKSCLALAALFAQGETLLEESSLSRNHTELLFAAKGVDIASQGGKIRIRPSSLNPLDFTVPGDISSAAFFLVAASILEGSHLKLTDVGINPTRTGILEVLEKMGASLQILSKPGSGGEDLADIEVCSTGLKATEIKGDLIPRLIDEIPILAVAAAASFGKTVFQDIGELRVKESDRIATVEEGLKKMGVSVHSGPSEMSIEGVQSFEGGATFESHGDHRIAMSFSIAALKSEGTSQVQGVSCVDTSYPKFWEHLRTLGVKVQIS